MSKIEWTEKTSKISRGVDGYIDGVECRAMPEVTK